MGLLTGSASFTRFSVTGELPEPFWDVVAERMAAHSFKDIDDTLDEFSIGWVSVADMFDAEFKYSTYAAGDYVVLTMRIDERKVAPAVLKKFVMKEEERLKREKQIPRLSRAVRVEIRERIRTELVRNLRRSLRRMTFAGTFPIIRSSFFRPAERPWPCSRIFSRKRSRCP